MIRPKPLQLPAKHWLRKRTTLTGNLQSELALVGQTFARRVLTARIVANMASDSLCP